MCKNKNDSSFFENLLRCARLMFLVPPFILGALVEKFYKFITGSKQEASW